MSLQKLFELNQGKPRRFEIVAKSATEAEVFVYDSIGAFYGIDPAAFVKSLTDIKAETIHLRINSPGGDVFGARAMMTAISAHPAKVIAHVDGLAASAASFLMLAADQIQISDGAFVMIHAPWAGMQGNAEALRQEADLLDKIGASMAADYAKRSGATPETVAKWMDGETWFSAQEALDAGLVDEVVESVAAKAEWDLSAYQHAPAVLIAAMATGKPEPTTEVQGEQSAPVQIEKEIHMDTSVNTGQTETPNVEAIQAAAQKAERTRVSEINRIGVAAKMPTDAIQAAIGDGTNIEAFKDVVLNAMVTASNAVDTRVGNASATVTRDATDTTRAGFIAALLNRGNATAFPLKPADNGFEQRGIVGMGLMRVAEECVRMAGQNPSRMDPSRMVQAALSTSDFPYLLGSVADVSLKAGYAKAPQTWQPLVGRKTVSNFKLQTLLDVGISAAFAEVPESGEFKAGSMTEGKDTYRCYTYGQIIALTRQAIINDDLGALTDVPMKIGMKWGIKQANLVWGVITANANLFDGVPLFHATHANLLASGTAIAVDSIGLVRKAMRAQTDLSGDLIDILPRYLVVPTTKEQLARQYMSSAFQPTAQTSINPWMGSLEIISEPRLDASSTTAWYVFADPGIRPVVIAISLQGNEGVYSETEYGFDVDGVKFKARADFGAAAVDYRGAYKNPGA